MDSPEDPLRGLSKRVRTAVYDAFHPPEYLVDAAWANFKKAIIYGGAVGVVGGLVGGTSAFIAGYHGLASGVRIAFAFGLPTTGFFSLAALMRLFGDAPQDYIYTSTSVLYCSYLAVKRYKRFDVIPGGMLAGILLGLGVYHGEEWARQKIAAWQTEIQALRAAEPTLTSVYDAARVYRQRHERQADEQQPFYEVVLEQHKGEQPKRAPKPSKLSEKVTHTLESIGAVKKLDVERLVKEKRARLLEIEHVLQQDEELRRSRGLPVPSMSELLGNEETPNE